MTFTKLNDIPSLPFGYLKQKYESTADTYYDPNSVSNFMKETLRYTGSEKPIFEDEMPRSSKIARQNILSIQEHGGRHSHAPFHPELFLGDLTKDQRGTENNPISSKMTDQSKFRHDRYIKGKLQNNAEVQMEGVVNERRMQAQVSDGFNDTAKRLTDLFSDSVGSTVRRSNPHPGNSTHKVGDTLTEDNKIYETQGEKVVPTYGMDIVNSVSNKVGINWQVQPDNKYGISSVSNLYRTKQDVDQSANAVYRLAEQDTSFQTEGMTSKRSVMKQLADQVRINKKNNMETEVKLINDSFKNQSMPKALNTKEQLNNHISNGTQSTPEQMKGVSTIYKYHNPSNQNVNQGIVKTNGKSEFGSILNKSLDDNKDRMQVLRQVRKTQKETFRNEDLNNRYTVMSENLKTAFVSNVSQIQEKEGMNKHNMKEENMKYRTAKMPVIDDRISNVKETKSKFGSIKEYMQSNNIASTVMPKQMEINQYKFDTDPTMDNNYQTRRGGSQTRYLISKDVINDNEITPLSEISTRYSTYRSS